MQNLLRMILTSVIILSFVFSMTACGPEKTVKAFKVKSAELSVYGGKLVTAFGDAYVAGEITREQLAELNKVSATFIKGLGVYRDAVAAAEKIVRSGQPLPRDTFGILDRLFAAEVVAAFTAIAVKVGVLTIGTSDKVKELIGGIQILLLAIKALVAETKAGYSAGDVYA